MRNIQRAIRFLCACTLLWGCGLASKGPPAPGGAQLAEAPPRGGGMAAENSPAENPPAENHRAPARSPTAASAQGAEVPDGAGGTESPRAPEQKPRRVRNPEGPFARAGRIHRLCEGSSEALEAGRRDEALRLAVEALGIEPGEARASALAARVLRQERRLEEGLDVVREARARHPREFPLLREEALILLDMGDREGALEALRKGPVLTTFQVESQLLRAHICALDENADGTLAALGNAVSWGLHDPRALRSERRFDFVRGEERFAELLKTVDDRAERIRCAGGRLLPKPKRAPENTRSYTPDELRSELRYRMRRKDSHVVDFEGVTLDGEPFRTADFAQKNLVLVVWAHWSGVSMELLPKIARLEEAFRDRNVAAALIAVDFFSVGESFVENTRKRLRDEKIDLPCIAMDPRDAIRELSARNCPLTFFLGPGGKRYMYAPGPLDYETLESLVEILISPEAEDRSGKSEEAPAPAAGSGG